MPYRSATPADRRRPTIADVAALAGVSPTTVSFALDDRRTSGIHPATRTKVLEAVRQLGYVPNSQARRLRLRRANAIGYHLREQQLQERRIFAMSFFQPLLQTADERGHQILAFTSDDDEDAIRRMAAFVDAHAVDGFVLNDVAVDDARVAYLSEAGVPFACLGRTAAHQPQSWIDLDNRDAMGQVADHLLSRGHTQFAYAAPDSPDYWWDERLAGFTERLAAHGIALDPRRVVRGSQEEIVARLETVLRDDERPTAVVTAGESVAVCAYRAAARAGLTVGADVAVTGFDPHLWMLDPPLTTLTVPFVEMSRLLVTRCLAEIVRDAAPEPGRYIRAELEVRDSG